MLHNYVGRQQMPPFSQCQEREESPLQRELKKNKDGDHLDMIDQRIRTVCWAPLFVVGCRRAYPSDPFFESTIVDYYRVNGRFSEDEARALEETILESSPRIKANCLTCLACTNDTWCCGILPRTEEAKMGFRLIRKARFNRRNGRLLLTIWPDYRDTVESFMNNFESIFESSLQSKRSTSQKQRHKNPIISRRALPPLYSKIHLVEAVPVFDYPSDADSNGFPRTNTTTSYPNAHGSDMAAYFGRRQYRNDNNSNIPMATVLSHSPPSSPPPSLNDADDDSSHVEDDCKRDCSSE